MASSRVVLGLAAIVTCASLATALYEYRQAHAAGQALAIAERQRVTSRPDAARSNAPSGQPRAQSVGVGPTGPASGAPAGQPNPSFAAILDLLSSPAMQKQNQIMAKLRLDGQYAALFKNLNLTPEQVDQFKNLLVEKSMVGFDSMSAAQQQGIDPHSDPRGFFQAVAEAEKTVDAQISNLLGSGGFTQFQQYQETVPARNTSNLLTQALSYTPTPLTEAQADGLIQALTQYGTPPLPPTNPFAVLNGDLGVVKLSDQGLAQIQGILSAPQLQALQEKIQQQSQLLEARKHMGP